MNEYTERVIDVIKAIPPGKVLTYGNAAALAGNPQGARTVVWILNAASGKYGLPWHRVINAKGEISLQGEGKELQRQLLEAEGIVFDAKGRIDLALYRWDGCKSQ